MPIKFVHFTEYFVNKIHLLTQIFTRLFTGTFKNTILIDINDLYVNYSLLYIKYK